jgi:glycosyltransferase involved in cell wall biosynthesis
MSLWGPALASGDELTHTACDKAPATANGIVMPLEPFPQAADMRSESRLKVLHVVVAGQIGGAERFLVNLATRPQLSGADHCLALMTPNPRLRAFYSDAGLRVYDRGPVRENPLSYLWRTYGPRDIAWLGRLLAEEDAALLHAHTFGSLVLAARAGRRYAVPVVRTEHGVRHYHDPSCALLRQWALHHTDRVAAVSAYVAQTVAAAAPDVRDRIRVILNGIDTAYFAPTPPRTEGPFTFAVIGRLEPVKQVSVAIEAVARTPGVRLLIAGDGSELTKLEKLTRKIGVEDRVRFLGFQADPRLVVAAADAVINCSRFEGLPLSIIEAASIQRPAVAFDGGPISEVVEERRTGWLVRQHTVEALAAALAEAAADRPRAAAFGVEARRLAVAKFRVESMCEAYGALYRELAARAPTKAIAG